MKVVLMGCMNDVEKIVAACALSTSKELPDEILKKMSLKKARKKVKSILARGHEGISEFAFFVFSVSGVSRVLTHQLVRHRIASYLQLSSRKTDYSNKSFIIPPMIEQSPLNINKKIFIDSVRASMANYKRLIKNKVTYEDARYLLPDSFETHISIGMNARSLNNLFGMRLCGRAQWEIRELAAKMRKEVKAVTPSLFWSEPRPCVRTGKCREGNKSCGYYKKREFKIERKKFLGYSDG